jgi:hypothetical protein
MPSRLTKTTSSPLGVTKRPATLLHGYIKLTLGDNRKIKYAARAQAEQQLLCRRRKNEKRCGEHFPAKIMTRTLLILFYWLRATT